jgi:uncharacterized protein
MGVGLMGHLTAIICLTIAVLLGSAGVSESADLRKGLDAYEKEDYATALRELKPLAEQGNADAQNKLGLMYRLRQGVSEDYKISVKFWRQLATEQGNALAMHHLGWLYQQGKGVSRNNKIAEKWWTLAAKQGLYNALFYKWLLNVLGPKEIQEKVFARLFHNLSVSSGIGIYDNAVYWYLLAAEQGHADAQSNLAQIYSYGKGVPQDYKTAVKWFKLAAEQGHTHAQYNLGFMYEKGQVVTQDVKTAVKWYRLSAEQGHAGAQYNLGEMYQYGRGVIRDNIYAHMWYSIAASSGKQNAVTNRFIVSKRMTSARIEDAQKLARECIRKKYKGC